TVEIIPNCATEFKVCPTIHDLENRKQLWYALVDGTIDFVVSDHSPCPPEMKLLAQGDFMNAWGGIYSLQLRLPIIWTDGRARGFTIDRITKWLSRGPARQVGLDQLKGSIKPGADADIVI